MKTIKTKNVLRKPLLFVALSGLFACAQLMPNRDIDSINETNIHLISARDIKTLLRVDKTNYKVLLDGENQTIDFKKNKSPYNLAQKLAGYITPKNIKQCDDKRIIYILMHDINGDKRCPQIIAKNAITKDNIKDNEKLVEYFITYKHVSAKTFTSCITEDNIKDNYELVKLMLSKDKSTAKALASCINKNNIKDNHALVGHILDIEKYYAKTFASYIDKNNIKDNQHAVSYILKADKSYAEIFASYIDKNNIKDNQSAVSYILGSDKSYATIFASYITKDNIKDNQHAAGSIIWVDKSYIKIFAAYITKDTIKDIWLIDSILEADKTYIKTFTSYIDKDNYLSIPQYRYELLIKYGLDLKAKLKECGFKGIKIDPLNLYLFAGEKYKNILYLNKISNIVTKVEFSEKTLENQYFASTFETILNFFRNQLEPIEIRYTLADIKKQAKNELEKGRYLIYHGRNSEAFVGNNIFKKILEIYYGQPIKKSWYTMHHKFPQNYPLYNRALKIKQTGNISNDYKQERDHMQFASDLFGSKGGSSALEYSLGNYNAGESRGIAPIDHMFELLAIELGLHKDALQKYYLRYKECFDLLHLLEKKFKHGTLLMYSLSEDILSNFTYVTHSSSGDKDRPISIDGIKPTFESKDVLDTLLNNPEKFVDKDKRYEYIFVMGQDHKDDKNKLGTTNPFNSKIDIYQFNFGADKKIAHAIQRGIDLLFYNQIIPDMIKDGVIKDTCAFKKEKINFEKEITIQSKL